MLQSQFVDPQTLILALLTTLLLPWMAWSSKVLIQIQIQLARGEENFDRIMKDLEDHEFRLRLIEANVGGRRGTDQRN